MVAASANAWLLPNESVLLSLGKPKLEERETGLAKGLRLMPSKEELEAGFGSLGTPGPSPAQLQAAQSARLARAKEGRRTKIQAESLFVTDKRLAFVTAGSVVAEIIIDKDYARDAVRKLAENNSRAMKEYRDASKKESYATKWKRAFQHKVLSPAEFGMSSLALLKGAERKGVVRHEVKLDMEEIGGVQGEWTKSFISHFVSGGHLTFSNMDKLADKFISTVEPKFSAMWEYVDSGQASKDYEASYTSVA
jgi:hypothetical protein